MYMLGTFFNKNKGRLDLGRGRREKIPTYKISNIYVARISNAGMCNGFGIG